MTGKTDGADTGWLHTTTPEEALLRKGKEPRHDLSASEAAAEAIALGRPVIRPEDSQLTEEQTTLQAGDPDADPDSIATSGDDAPGSSNASPDASDIDQVGELYGVTRTGTSPGGLVLAEELVAERDRERWENNPDSKDKGR